MKEYYCTKITNFYRPGHFSPVHLLSCSNFFTNRQHKVTIFLPNYHRNTHPILNQLEQEGTLVYTPSRAIENKRLTCYDDRYVLKLAVDVDGVIVSNDGYRDLLLEMPEYKKFLKERLLMFSFVGEK
jgi:ribonuclease ZC3H12